jgi:hypothetical protein
MELAYDSLVDAASYVQVTVFQQKLATNWYQYQFMDTM